MKILGCQSSHREDGDKNFINLHLTMKSSCLARFARAFFIFVHFTIVIDLPRQEMTRLSVG